MKNVDQIYYPGDVICCAGALRQGKTMAATMLAIRHWTLGYTVVSNYPIHLPYRVKRVESLNDYLQARESVLVWDEMQDSLNSRNFAKNTEATQEAIFLGKRGNILIYTAPAFRQVDLNIRLITSYLYKARRLQVGLSLIQRYFFDIDIEMLFPEGKFLLHHKVWGPAYDTKFENVRVLPMVAIEPDRVDAIKASRPKASAARRENPDPSPVGPRERPGGGRTNHISPSDDALRRLLD